METKPSLTTATAGLSTFLSFGAKSVHPDVLEKMLIGRLKTANLLEQYVREIATNGINQQVFMVGPRGSGKTHLLRVLYHRVQDLVQSRQVIVAYFAEEEYGISGYLDFLIRIINAFMRWYDADKPYLIKQLDQLRETPETRQENVAETLISEYVGDKPLLILSENFDGILEALGKQGQAKLRAWLYRHNRISIIATAQAISPDLGREDQPFYGFFTPIYLKKLSYDDSLALLVSLAEAEQNTALIAHLAGKGKAQVRAINELVKGNHRLLVTFYEFLKADSMAELSVLFMKTMNDLKPYYETFIRYLPAQQQKILHHLALARTPQRGTDIAKNCFIPTASLTKQLSELQRRHLIDALTDTADKRNKLYDVAEPLLRIAIEIGEQKEGIAALFIDFLALYYSHEEIRSQKKVFEELHMSEEEPLKRQKLYWEVEARDKALKLQIELGLVPVETSSKVQELMRLGDHYSEIGNHDEALNNYLQVVQMNPGHSLAWYSLGKVYFEQQDYEKSIESYQTTIHINPKFEWAWDRLGDTYAHQDNYEKAIESYQKATQINPRFEWPWFDLGKVYFEQQDYEKSIESYRTAVHINPEFELAWARLGDTYAQQDDYEKALKAYQAAIKINSNQDLAWYGLGVLYASQSNYAEAIKAYQKATKISPDFSWYWYGLGKTYIQSKDYLKSIKAYQKFIELNLDHDFVIRSLVDAITKGLQTETMIELDLIDLESWLQGRSDLEIITTYVSVYRRVVFGKEEQALLELPKEQRTFFEREILGRSAE